MNAPQTATKSHCWALLTGEYPPDPGGVSDYTYQLAHGLSAAGDQVHVVAPGEKEQIGSQGAVRVHRLPGLLGWQGRQQLRQTLASLPTNTRLLVQYVPHAYGWKGMNVPLCWAIAGHRPRPWVMFHEVSFGIEKQQSLKHNFLGLVTREMARLLARGAERTFVSSASWLPLLTELGPLRAEPHWLPIFSNLPTEVDATAVEQRFTHWSRAGQRIVLGHFGTYGGLIGPLLHDVLAGVFAAVAAAGQQLQVVLIGRGSREFAAAWQAHFPAWAADLTATGGAPAERTAESIAACDLLLQPYPDGVSTRRGGTIAALALGRPVIANCGPLTEPCWTTANAVELCLQSTPADYGQAVVKLIHETSHRLELGQRAKAWYDAFFALEQTVRVLRAAAENDA